MPALVRPGKANYGMLVAGLAWVNPRLATEARSVSLLSQASLGGANGCGFVSALLMG